MRFALTAISLAALVAACGEKPATTDGAAPAADASAPAPAAASAAAAPGVEGPAAGKWSITMTTMGQTMPPTEVCYEKQVSFAEAEQMQRASGVTCSEQSYNREGDAWVGHSVCTMDAGGTKMTVTSDTRVSGDFSRKYTMEMTNRMDPAPMAGMEEQKMTMNAERIGDC